MNVMATCYVGKIPLVAVCKRIRMERKQVTEKAFRRQVLEFRCKTLGSEFIMVVETELETIVEAVLMKTYIL